MKCNNYVYTTMYCCMFIVIVAFINTTAGSCEPNDKIEESNCPVYKRIYPIYKKLESIVTNDSEILYRLREVFFSAPQISHFVESERANIARIKVCWVLNETWPPPACNSNSQTAIIETQCWHFRWSSSPALNMIAVEQLLAFDPVLTGTIYSRFVSNLNHQVYLLVFNISPAIFPCTPSEDDLIDATVLLLTWVSTSVYISTYICSRYFLMHTLIKYILCMCVVNHFLLFCC